MKRDQLTFRFRSVITARRKTATQAAAMTRLRLDAGLPWIGGAGAAP
jgi:hypothetical protein